MEKIQYGVIGCGEHALQSHAVPNKDIAELALAGVFDLSEERMDRFVDEVEDADTIQRFATREEILNSKIGAVLIGTPDDFHFDDLAAAVQAGKHAFIEKPLAVNAAQQDLYVNTALSVLLTNQKTWRYDGVNV